MTTTIWTAIILAGFALLRPTLSQANNAVCIKTFSNNLDLKQKRKAAFVNPSKAYTHIVRVSGANTWGTNLYDFTLLLSKIKPTRKSLQNEWFPLSAGGRIWTFSEGANDFSDGGNHFEVTINIRDDFRFANNLDTAKDYLIWLNTDNNQLRKNRFASGQVDRLISSKLPYHSEYYKDRKIAGFAHWMAYGSKNRPWSGVEFSIVTADAIESVKFKPRIKKGLINDEDSVFPGFKLITREYHFSQ
jgi:hypothetical protein